MQQDYYHEDDYDRLVRGCEEFYFGSGEPAPEPQHDVIRYIEYKVHIEGISVNEAAKRSMAHLWNYVTESDKTVVILTGYHSERSLPQNKSMNRQLAQDLRSLSWGYIPVLGYYTEPITGPNGQEQRVQSHEELFFVFATGEAKQVISPTIQLLKKYDKEAALVKFPNTPQAMLLFADGSTMDVGTWHAEPEQMAQYYTRMRSSPSGRQFKFEAAGDDSRITRMAVDVFFKTK